ncbi:tRNA 2-selenouridine(34) synthase MnmH [Paenibacillus gansuensis]|uniref:tRNA 2-selenouridine(34) synthase MnmH n=1 Tax=Paenibacillus gansuensis TaxID=306542 RepID=A0ABW5P7E9_9BACL
MIHEITVEELLELQRKGEAAFIDVRSPSEFQESTIPDSVNIPIFTDEERAEIGTLYKQVSVDAAKDRGLEIVSAKLPSFVRSISGTEHRRKVVFCWRGGMRSRTSATLASLMGLQMYKLNGGFRAYRKWVVETLESFGELPPCYVINGYTGTGKTELLQRLEKLGYPVLNFEEMAQHRGSIFGHIGLAPSNQKSFESALVHQLLRWKEAPYLIMEAESKRVGKAVLPEFVVRGKEQGKALFIEMPVAQRVANIMADYKPEEHKDDCLNSFKHIEKRIHTPVAAEIRQALEQGRYETAVELLLTYYYDSRYQHATDRYENDRVTIQAKDVDDALQQLVKQLPPPPGRYQ